MKSKKEEELYKLYRKYLLEDDSPEHGSMMLREIAGVRPEENDPVLPPTQGLYDKSDFDILPGYFRPPHSAVMDLKTLDELLDQDNKREEDGFPRRIKIGKLIKPGQGKDNKVIIVPSTTEPKFYHDDSVTEESDGEGEGETGGSGEGDEGEVIGEQPAQPQQGEGEGTGAGQGDGSDHDVSQDAFDLGRVITEKFKLPNLKQKGTKRSMTKYIYDLTDRNRGFGQILEKKETIKKIVQTNIQLGRVKAGEPIDTQDLLINPNDQVFRILSKEKDFESQAMVFFLRDYSGSMQGDPTKVIAQQHLLLYSWLMFQYQGNVETKFIVHDTEAKEVPDFDTYYRSQVAGGTKIAPAFNLVNKIVEEGGFAAHYNIYVFYGTDGDDWDSSGKEMLKELKEILKYSNRVGITVAKNSWAGSSPTTVEKYMDASGLLKSMQELLRLDAFHSAGVSESRIVEGIRNLIS